MKNKTNYYPKFIPWENTPYKPNIKNKTKVKAEWEKEFNRLVSGEWKIGCYECDNGIKIDEVKDFIKKNFVAKGEVRERINALEKELKPLSDEYNREYRFWMDGYKNMERKRLLEEYENGGKGNKMLSLSERINELEEILKSLE